MPNQLVCVGNVAVAGERISDVECGWNPDNRQTAPELHRKPSDEIVGHMIVRVTTLDAGPRGGVVCVESKMGRLAAGQLLKRVPQGGRCSEDFLYEDVPTALRKTAL